MQTEFQNPVPARFAHAHAGLHLEDLPFWVDLAQAARGPILELGCGTGRVLAPVAAAASQANPGQLVVGLDNDRSLLSFLHSQQPRLPLVCADMRRFHLAGGFSLILLPCNTLSMFAAADRRLILACARQHLSEAGLFAASLPNPSRWASLPAAGESDVEDTFSLSNTAEDVQVSSAWVKEAGWLQVAWHYDLLLPDGQVRRHTFRVSHSLASLADLQGDFAAAGWRVTAEYGDFDHSAYSQSSPFWIVTAKK